jgi:hypothetical protein
MSNISATIVTIFGGIITLAVIAVLVSQQAKTAGVVTSAGDSLAKIIGAAVAPVTGSTSSSFGSPAVNIGGISL